MATYQIDVRAEYYETETGRQDVYRWPEIVRAVSARHALDKALVKAQTRMAGRMSHRVSPKWKVDFWARIVPNIH